MVPTWSSDHEVPKTKFISSAFCISGESPSKYNISPLWLQKAIKCPESIAKSLSLISRGSVIE
ncbi:hypothetical protein ADA01nite_11250 [Aneurinibacillus danicus]|uniref:Uncharacterized protein n=1 Tax=Aneurinibacillus danicus TaxID=267746 RepID=A0A511V414_9BACL|nr:hypothetical protein ADA01nite_11250 [Aneurinibacillus danicus]